MEIYDVIIIGEGPAGMSSGIYSGRSKLKTLILEKSNAGGRAENTREIVNYPGVPSTSGPELTSIMHEQVKSFGVEIKKENVKSVDFSSPIKKVVTRKNEYFSKTVIIASGTNPRVLGIPGEKEFAGRGVAYCATCDGEFFKNQEIAVLGSGDQAIEESIYLTRFVKKITIIVLHDEGVLDCNKIAASKAKSNPKIKFIYNSTLKEINGDDEVESINIENINTKEITTLHVKGIFMFVGMSPNTAFLGDSVENSKGWIVTNNRMETNVSGVYAVGDVRKKELRQIVTSVSDGAIAAVNAGKYIEEINVIKDLIKEKIVFFDSGDNISLENIKCIENAEKFDILFHKSLADLLKIKLDLETHILVLSSKDVKEILHL